MGYSDQIKRDRKSLISLQPELTGYEIMRPKIKIKGIQVAGTSSMHVSFSRIIRTYFTTKKPIIIPFSTHYP